MTLLRQISDRFDKSGKPFMDYFLGWRYEGKTYWVRINPSFCKDFKFLSVSAVNVPKGECLAKYIDQVQGCLGAETNLLPIGYRLSSLRDSFQSTIRSV